MEVVELLLGVEWTAQDTVVVRVSNGNLRCECMYSFMMDCASAYTLVSLLELFNKFVIHLLVEKDSISEVK